MPSPSAEQALRKAHRFEALGDNRAALQAYRQACQLDPARREAWLGLARLQATGGQLSQATATLKQLIAGQPRDAEAWERLGRIHAVRRHFDSAAHCLEQALNLDPKRRDAAHTQLFVLQQLGQVPAILDRARQTLQCYPHDLPAQLSQALSLPPVYRDKQDLNRWRQRYQEQLTELCNNDPGPWARANDISTLQWSNFYLAYQGHNDCLLQQQYSALMRGLITASGLNQRFPIKPKADQPQGVVRIGFVSAFLRDCTVGRYFTSWVTDLPEQSFETFVYFTGPVADSVTKKLAEASAHFRHLPHGLASVAEQISQDQLDLLIYPEVGMEGIVNLLAQLRLAPIQLAAWGHPVTTGSPNIDYFISCHQMEPEDRATHYSEQLITLPGLGTRYPRPQMPKSQGREHWHLPLDKHIYLIPQSLYKIHPDNDALYVQILKRDENAVLVFFAPPTKPILNAFTDRLQRALSEQQLAPRQQIKFLPQLPWPQFRAVNAVADVMLDSLHWSGGQTSLDALAVNLPIVTLPGRFMRGRQTQAMLKILQLPELIATSSSNYIDIALRIAQDSEYQQSLRQRIDRHAHRLFNQSGTIETLATELTRLHQAHQGASN